MVKFIKNYPAIFIPKLKILAISDLHLGIEFELREKGIRIFDNWKKLKADLLKLKQKLKPKLTVIVGDVKHRIIGIQKSLLEKFFAELGKVAICKGNHDAGIEKVFEVEMGIHNHSKSMKITKRIKSYEDEIKDSLKKHEENRHKKIEDRKKEAINE